jgi:hypothetical protein
MPHKKGHKVERPQYTLEEEMQRQREMEQGSEGKLIGRTIRVAPKLKAKTAAEAAKSLSKKAGTKSLKPLSSSLSTVSSKSKKSDPYAGQGLFSPEKVEKRAEKRAKKAKSRQTADEAKTKRILARKQKKSARKGHYAAVERIEEVKKSMD